MTNEPTDEAATLSIGSRLRLRGGYDMEPKWLSGKSEVLGTLTRMIPGQNDKPAAVVELDEPLSVDGIEGRIVLLELRYVGAKWTNEGVVHVELCDFEPAHETWRNRRQGLWVESHASYDNIG